VFTPLTNGTGLGNDVALVAVWNASPLCKRTQTVLGTVCYTHTNLQKSVVLKTSDEWLSLNTRMFVFHPVLVERGDSERLQGGRPRDRNSIAGRGKKPIL